MKKLIIKTFFLTSCLLGQGIASPACDVKEPPKGAENILKAKSDIESFHKSLKNCLANKKETLQIKGLRKKLTQWIAFIGIEHDKLVDQEKEEKKLMETHKKEGNIPEMDKSVGKIAGNKKLMQHWIEAAKDAKTLKGEIKETRAENHKG